MADQAENGIVEGCVAGNGIICVTPKEQQRWREECSRRVEQEGLFACDGEGEGGEEEGKGRGEVEVEVEVELASLVS